MAMELKHTLNERVAQLALADYKMAEHALEHDPSYGNHLRFEAAKLDLDEALKAVRQERGLAVHDGSL